MLQDLYDLLLRRQLEPRWVRGQVHVEVVGRLFMVADHSPGVAVHTLAATAPMVFEDADHALEALGLSVMRRRTFE